MRRILILLFIFVSLITPASGQKVGLVLSGGGASGMAHIGVLKALEENNIPIDYITGTSIGAMVGALYASGYSPAQIEAIFTSEDFRNLARGVVNDKYLYYFKQKEPNASWISIRFSSNSIIESSLPTNLISPVPVDLGLLEMLAGPGAAADYNFDSLFIPFRCVAADITNKVPVIFDEGALNVAVRASIAYPFYLKPVMIDSSLLVDGGLYNNFPADVMYNEFLPDIIIGSNVAGPPTYPEEDNLLSQIRGMLVTITNYETGCENGIMIEPQTSVSLFDFSDPAPAIAAGYNSTLEKIEEIKKSISRRSDPEMLIAERKQFRSQIPELKFGELKIEGLNKGQSQYAQKLLQKKEKEITFDKFKKNYYRLLSDNKIKSVFPNAIYDKEADTYIMELKVKKEREFTAEFGGNISNRPIHEGFVGLQYHYFGKTAITAKANTYFGRFYNSGHFATRMDFPSRIPYFLDGTLTFNQWDFYKSNNNFTLREDLAFTVQKEKFGSAAIGLPLSNKGLFNVGYTYGQLRNNYYQDEDFNLTDTTDQTDFEFVSAHLRFTANSLNRKQYASEGGFFSIITRYIQGEEFTVPGSILSTQKPIRSIHEWWQTKLIVDNYFLRRQRINFGVYGEMAYSTQPFFHNYTASVLAAPAFMPTTETKTLYLKNFRSYKYAAGGGKVIINLFRESVDLRLEGYVFQPYEAILENIESGPYFSKPLDRRFYLASSTLAYHSPLGPLAASVNYYHGEKNPWSFLFHFGYIIFNRRALD